jgi:hypothetical protein
MHGVGDCFSTALGDVFRAVFIASDYYRMFTRIEYYFIISCKIVSSYLSLLLLFTIIYITIIITIGLQLVEALCLYII